MLDEKNIGTEPEISTATADEGPKSPDTSSDSADHPFFIISPMEKEKPIEEGIVTLVGSSEEKNHNLSGFNIEDSQASQSLRSESLNTLMAEPLMKESVIENNVDTIVEIDNIPAVKVDHKPTTEITSEIAEESTDESAEESTDVIAEEAADVIAEEPVDVIAEEAADVIVEEAADVIAEEAADVIAEEAADVITEEAAAEITEEASSESVEELSAEIDQELSAESIEEPSAERVEEAVTQTEEEASSETVDEALDVSEDPLASELEAALAEEIQQSPIEDVQEAPVDAIIEEPSIEAVEEAAEESNPLPAEKTKDEASESSAEEIEEEPLTFANAFEVVRPAPSQAGSRSTWPRSKVKHTISIAQEPQEPEAEPEEANLQETVAEIEEVTPMEDISNSSTTDSESLDLETLDPHIGDKYVDTQTKQEWAEADEAFEERRKARIENRRQAREEAKAQKRRRNTILGALAALLCTAGLGYAWSQGILTGYSGAPASQNVDTSNPVDQQEETPAEAEASTAAAAEAETAAETVTEAATTEAAAFDQSTEAGMEEIADYVEPTNAAGVSPADPVTFFDGYSIDALNGPVMENAEVESPYAILVDLDTGEVLTQRDASTRISPASMTKILTVLVAAEHLVQEDLDDIVTIDAETLDYVYQNDCSVVGFQEGEEVTVRDLFYGTILPSGADAALVLAKYVAGSQEKFVDMMNAKLEALGLSDSAHFTNCIGLYDENHYCTISDMAMIMKAAVKDNYARQILAKHVYTTTVTEQNPEGVVLSNWFLRRIEDCQTPGDVMCAKTGFVDESGNCAASYFLSSTGKHYVCVTAGAYSSWRCIYDHVQIYNDYVKE